MAQCAWFERFLLLCLLLQLDIHLFPSSMQVKYDINKVQLKMLQITSRRAEQAITIRCKNLAFVDGQLTFHGFKSGTTIRPNNINNGCLVSSSKLAPGRAYV